MTDKEIKKAVPKKTVPMFHYIVSYSAVAGPAGGKGHPKDKRRFRVPKEKELYRVLTVPLPTADKMKALDIRWKKAVAERKKLLEKVRKRVLAAGTKFRGYYPEFNQFTEAEKKEAIRTDKMRGLWSYRRERYLKGIEDRFNARFFIAPKGKYRRYQLLPEAAITVLYQTRPEAVEAAKPRKPRAMVRR